MNELLLGIYQETYAWGFPKLEALVTEHSIFILFISLWNIENCNIVSIQIDRFVGQN